ncbi:MAG: hypothetical protein U0235_35310 [Polyangiaceae bacterium]
MPPNATPFSVVVAPLVRLPHDRVLRREDLTAAADGDEVPAPNDTAFKLP